jgi:glycosyltransferase involved in cell wall biosynthesis
MLSAIIPARESERSLVPTLNALFPGVMAGLLAEVIVADAGSHDATREVADIAGCQFSSLDGPLGERLKGAVATSRGGWLLFLPAGSVLDASWVDAVQNFIAPGNVDRAAIFRDRSSVFDALLRRRKPEHGLLIARRTYDMLGGHDASDSADTLLLRKLGRRVDTLPASVAIRRDT